MLSGDKLWPKYDGLDSSSLKWSYSNVFTPYENKLEPRPSFMTFLMPLKYARNYIFCSHLIKIKIFHWELNRRLLFGFPLHCIIQCSILFNFTFSQPLTISPADVTLTARWRCSWIIININYYDWQATTGEMGMQASTFVAVHPENGVETLSIASNAEVRWWQL